MKTAATRQYLDLITAATIAVSAKVHSERLKAASRAQFDIAADDRTFSMQSLTADLRLVGEPTVSAKGRSERVWHYPTPPEAAAYFTTEQSISAVLSAESLEAKYQIWRTPESHE